MIRISTSTTTAVESDGVTVSTVATITATCDRCGQTSKMTAVAVAPGPTWPIAETTQLVQSHRAACPDKP